MTRELSIAAQIQDRLLGLRDRLLMSERFRSLAARFPGTRFIARRRASQVFDLCAGFVYSQVLLSCVQLGLLELLAARPADLRTIAEHLALAPEVAERLVRAAVALNLIEERAGERFGIGPLGSAVVGNRAVESMIEHHATLYADLANPVALLRGEAEPSQMSQYWPYATSSSPKELQPEDVADYSQLMSQSQTLIAEQVLSRYPFAQHTRLLDVGGGDGTFLSAVASKAPGLELSLFDLPAVVEHARKKLAAQGIESRATIQGGDFFKDALPEGADLITLIRILHDHDDADIRVLLRNARSALAEGGTLLIAEPMAGTHGAKAVGDAYFAFYLLAMGTGRARTAAELKGFLTEAGFTTIESLPTSIPLQTQLISARA